MSLESSIVSLSTMQYLGHALSSNRLSHALLFLGYDAALKQQAALVLAQGILCPQKTVSNAFGCGNCTACTRIEQLIHPNVHVVDIEPGVSKELRIDQIRGLKREQRMQGYEKGAQIWILVGAHRMTEQAANALLKTLEEPSKEQFFILFFPSLANVMPTVASRCQTFLFPQTSLQENHEAQKLTRDILTSSYKRRLGIIEALAKNKDELPQILFDLQPHILSLVETNELSPQTAKQILSSIHLASQLLSQHVNQQLVLDELLLKNWPISNL